MKVALLGAPGSEKTKIARRLVRRLNAESKSWTVIDGYIDNLQKNTDLPFGFQSDIKHNLQAMCERWTLEDEAAANGLHSVTCGSIYESVIYSAAATMRIPSLQDEAMILEETQVSNIVGSMMGILERKTFDYDALFYLPLADRREDWNGVVDAKLPEVLEGFFRYAVMLEGTDRNKVDNAEDIIRAIILATTKDDKQAV